MATHLYESVLRDLREAKAAYEQYRAEFDNGRFLPELDTDSTLHILMDESYRNILPGKVNKLRLLLDLPFEFNMVNICIPKDIDMVEGVAVQEAIGSIVSERTLWVAALHEKREEDELPNLLMDIRYYSTRVAKLLGELHSYHP
ncbi:MAG TPA: hypothetical protein DIT07_14760 [Sphingobacteriaceae bacterium]|nr:hypothetical protein [Sphingobacteriaceae bacterium]